jgi:hypothetical protein
MLALEQSVVSGMKFADNANGKERFEGNDRLFQKKSRQASKGPELFRMQTPLDHLGSVISLWM